MSRLSVVDATGVIVKTQYRLEESGGQELHTADLGVMQADAEVSQVPSLTLA